VGVGKAVAIWFIQNIRKITMPRRMYREEEVQVLVNYDSLD
jgi:hypothetical protein